jgi:hypothetical protein
MQSILLHTIREENETRKIITGRGTINYIRKLKYARQCSCGSVDANTISIHFF